MYATPQQIRAARGLLNWKQDRLADVSDTSVGTVKKYEQDGKISDSSRRKICKALEAAQIRFVNDGVLLPSESKSKAFEGSDAPDIFYKEMLAIAKECGGDLWASYDTAETFVQSLGVVDADNLERIEELSRHATIRCLLTDYRNSSLELPMCQVRAVPRLPFNYECRVVCGDYHAQISKPGDSNAWFSYYLSQKKNVAREAALDFASSWSSSVAPQANIPGVKRVRG